MDAGGKRNGPPPRGFPPISPRHPRWGGTAPRRAGEKRDPPRRGVPPPFPPGTPAVGEERPGAGGEAVAWPAELVVTRSLWGDAGERARRRLPMSVPGELQWRLLPPLTFMSANV